MKLKRYKMYLAAALVVAFGSFGAVLATGTGPQLGLDLQGGLGVILTARGEGVNQERLQQAANIISQRIDSIGVAEPQVTTAGSNNIAVQLPGVENEERALELIGTTAQLTFRQVQAVYPPGAPKNRVPTVTKDTGPAANDDTVVYPSDVPGQSGTLYKLGPAVLTGDVVTRAEAVFDPQAGQGWVVTLDMDDEGSQKWARFTSRLACLRDKGEQVKDQAAIILDGRVESAARMTSPQESPEGGVECGKGLTGGTQIDVGDESEAKDLALVLRYGALPVTLEQSQVQTVSPTLGRDSLRAGITAGIMGLVLVMIYLVLYYRALGLVAWLGLLVFTAAIYSVMALLGESAGLTLTLAGVAGIIVSVGITTDSYIVSFERLKDEVRAGKSVRAAVERGMARAFKTILVADFVTGAAAVILFFLAVGSVKGFALTLGLSTLIDVFVTYFFTRSAVNLLARTRLFTGARFIGLRDALGAAQ